MTGPFARPLPGSLDLVWSLFGPLHAGLAAALVGLGIPNAVADAVVELLMWGEFVAIGLLAVSATRRIGAGRVAVPVALVAAAVAAGVIGWTVTHATAHLHELFLRPDHLIMAGAMAIALAPLPVPARRLVLIGVSAVFIVRFYGLIPFAVLVGTGLAGVAAARVIGCSRRSLLIASQAAVVAAVLGAAFWLLPRNPLLGIALHGLAFFMLLRHVSWAVEVVRGAPPRALDYAYYLLFYPGAAGLIGAPEVFTEFHQRNLAGAPVQPDAEVMRRLVRGVASLWLARRIPVSLEAVVGSRDFLSVWTLQAVYWVEVALFLMGIWAIVDTVALLLGVRLRQNFARMLSVENPSDLWRSVRATMTFWLVYHVYAPLGGNRGRQALHIAAALGFSLVWHLVGVPFLAFPPEPLHFAPFTLWAVVTCAALVGHVHARQVGWRLLPAATPAWLRRAVHRVLTLLLASLAVTLPGFQSGAAVHDFVPFVRALLGIGQ